MSKIDRLNNSNNQIRAISYSSTNLVLSNGVVIEGLNQVAKFFRRLDSGWNLDLAYNIDENIREEYIAHKKIELCRKGGVSCQEKNPHIRQIATANLINAIRSGSNRAKYKSGELAVWNKGLTKETDSRVKEISNRQIGAGNTSHRMSEETRSNAAKKLSNTMKNKIANGEFTPNVHNSRTHWQVEYNGKKFRSSWEAAWSMLNPTYEYETIRVLYRHDGYERVYIVDFYDPGTHTLIEVKPKAHTYDLKFKNKVVAATEWATHNNGSFRIITEEYFIEHMDKILSSDLPENAKSKIKGIR